jgi:hypothetical protein
LEVRHQISGVASSRTFAALLVLKSTESVDRLIATLNLCPFMVRWRTAMIASGSPSVRLQRGVVTRG